MTDAGLPAIDEEAFATLEDIADGDAEFIAEVLNQYLSDAEALMTTLRQGSESGSAEDVERSAHTLKSASANVGALRLSSACQELQRMGRAGKLDGCAEKVAAADEEYARVVSEIGQRLAKLG